MPSPSPQDPTRADAPAAAPGEPRASLRRRQFLRAGAVPVTLTLASRPVRAWHCNTSSAWGSALVNPAASVQTRTASHAITDESWTIYNWQTDTTRAGLDYPWRKVKLQWGFADRATAKSTLSVAQLFTGMQYPTGLVGTDKVYAKLNSTGVSTFAKYMMVARLNSLFITNVASCLKSNNVDQLPAMIDGYYLPANLDGITQPWSQTTIMQFLYDNWIVRPS